MEKMAKKRSKEISIRSSAAEYLTFVAATGGSNESVEVRYEDENIWITQKMLAVLYEIDVAGRLRRLLPPGQSAVPLFARCTCNRLLLHGTTILPNRPARQLLVACRTRPFPISAHRLLQPEQPYYQPYQYRLAYRLLYPRPCPLQTRIRIVFFHWL